VLYDKDYPGLFDLDVYGSLVGMFELNNLGMSIPSPLANWLEGLLSESDHQDADQPSSSSNPESLVGEIPVLSPALLPGFCCYPYHSQFHCSFKFG